MTVFGPLEVVVSPTHIGYTWGSGYGLETIWFPSTVDRFSFLEFRLTWGTSERSLRLVWRWKRKQS